MVDYLEGVGGSQVKVNLEDKSVAFELADERLLEPVKAEITAAGYEVVS